MKVLLLLGVWASLNGLAFPWLPTLHAESSFTIPVLADGSLQLQDSDRSVSKKDVAGLTLQFPPKCTVKSLINALDEAATQLGVGTVFLAVGRERAPYHIPLSDGNRKYPWYELALRLRGTRQIFDVQTDPSLPKAVQLTVHFTKTGLKADQASDLSSLREKLKLLKSSYNVIGIKVQAESDVQIEPLMEFFLMANDLKLESYFLSR